jgi:hypothetical protein
MSQNETILAFADALGRHGMRSAGMSLRVMLALRFAPVVFVAALDEIERDADEHANLSCTTAAGMRLPEDEKAQRQRAETFVRLSFVARSLRDGDSTRAATMLAEVP